MRVQIPPPTPENSNRLRAVFLLKLVVDTRRFAAILISAVNAAPICAVGSGGEHHLDTVGVTSSNLVPRTTIPKDPSGPFFVPGFHSAAFSGAIG